MSSGNTTFSNTFDAFAGNTGAILTVTNDGNIFGGNIGTTTGRLASININGNTQVGGANTTVSTISSAATTIANNKTLTIDSSSSVIQWFGVIDGAGSLSTTQTPPVGSYSTHFDYSIGSITALSSVSFGARTSIYLSHNNISAASLYLGESSSMNNPGVINISGANGITLTGNSTIIHDGGDAPSITSTSGININGHTLTAQGSQAITGNLQTTGNGNTGGTFAINSGNITLAGSIGAVGNTLTAVNFNSDNTLTIDSTSGARNIYAPVTTTSDGTGTLALSGGGTTTAYYSLGATAASGNALSAINLNNQTLVLDSTAGPSYIHGQFTTTTGGAGTIATQGTNTVYIYNDIGNGTAISTINANANTTLYGGTVNASSINIASGKTLTIDAASGSRSITGWVINT